MNSDIKIPVDYDAFLPPDAGGWYSDTVFGSVVWRVSGAKTTPDAADGGHLSWITDEYSTCCPFNSDNSRLILVHESYFGLYDGAGKYLKALPLEVNSSSEPRWSRQDNRTLYFHAGNRLATCDVESGVLTVVHTFTEYSSITGMGESDISLDGDHLVFCGTRGDGGQEVFLYTISKGSKSPASQVSGHPLDAIYVTPQNNVLLAWVTSGVTRYAGQELFDSNMKFLRQVSRSDGHKHLTVDADGSEVLIWCNSNDPQPICDNGIVKIRLSDGKQTCLTTLDWSLAVHVTAPDNAGFCFIETYDPTNPEPNTPGWKPYTSELLQIKLDGTVTRLAHHRSRPNSSYNYQPRVSCSRDGSRFVFNSNMDLQAISGEHVDYSDVYMVVTGQAPPPISPAPPAPVKWTRYEQDNAAIKYAGDWYPNRGAFNSGGSAVLGMDKGCTATFTFTGTGVCWIGFRDQWSGIAGVSLDGAAPTAVDTYSAKDLAQTVIWSATGLANVPHVLAVAVTGEKRPNSGAAWIWVDAFDVQN